jgi:hypothetical protein
VTTTELDDALRELARSTHAFLATMEGVTAPDYLASPGPGRWSLAENAEHTTVVIRGVERLFSTRLLNQPMAGAERRVTDADLSRFLPDRGRQVQAPEMVLPKGRWTTREDMAAALTATTEGISNWSRGAPADLRDYGAPHPVLGPLDGIQWLLFLGLHTDRHARQAEEIRKVVRGEK